MVQYLKDFLVKTIVGVGAPTGVGMIAIFEKSIPILTVLSLIVGMFVGIISVILKIKKYKQDKKN